MTKAIPPRRRARRIVQWCAEQHSGMGLGDYPWVMARIWRAEQQARETRRLAADTQAAGRKTEAEAG
jgi:hypothetical protein